MKKNWVELVFTLDPSSSMQRLGNTIGSFNAMIDRKKGVLCLGLHHSAEGQRGGLAQVAERAQTGVFHCNRMWYTR